MINDKLTTNGIWPQSFAVGAYAKDVHRSMDLLHKTSKAIRENIVDDVHIGNRFADMIQTVSEQLLSRLVHFPAHASAAGYASHPQDSNASAAHSSATDTTNGFHHNGAPMGSWPDHLLHGAISQFGGAANGLGFDDGAFNFNDIGPFNPNNTVAMAPPGYGYDGPMQDFADGSGIPLNQPWVALNIRPLTDLANGQDNADVSSGLYGPTINGIDFLDQIRFPQPPAGPMLPPDQDQHDPWG